METGIFTSSGAIVFLAGPFANATISGADMDLIMSGAECFLNVTTRKNWAANYDGLSDNVKFMLNNVANSHAAIEVIQRDMSGFGPLSEAESKINVLRDIELRGTSILRDIKSQEFVDGA